MGPKVIVPGTVTARDMLQAVLAIPVVLAMAAAIP
jgi:hypothetical protein